MRSRIVVAIIGIPLVYLCVLSEWKRNLVFVLLVSVACTIALAEFYQMMRRYRPYVPAGLVSVALTPLLAWKAMEPGIFACLLIVAPLTMIFATLSVPRKDQAAAIMTTVMGVLYIGMPAGLVVVLRASPHGFGLVLLLLAGIWATDTGAYLIGRKFGRHKLAPRISPNKTIEGFIGGFALGTLVIWYGHYLDRVDGQYWISGIDALMLGIAIAFATPVGDLFESMLKRSVGVKDSGRLLGDHGGMLDRLDALFMAMPVMYFGCFVIGVL